MKEFKSQITRISKPCVLQIGVTSVYFFLLDISVSRSSYTPPRHEFLLFNEVKNMSKPHTAQRLLFTELDHEASNATEISRCPGFIKCDQKIVASSGCQNKFHTHVKSKKHYTALSMFIIGFLIENLKIEYSGINRTRHSYNLYCTCCNESVHFK